MIFPSKLSEVITDSALPSNHARNPWDNAETPPHQLHEKISRKHKGASIVWCSFIFEILAILLLELQDDKLMP